ncbi:uncharacterized protein LOC114666499 [Erpetoichthys calabaricus]|uniref:uncharacterized protein LOC114666499 n=1 Tax=Erpetoichthys calabaricus TaxID=27687 RepID=UPI0010A0653E|nr:uncharacterized protein LOC114666499 [Erpetoichthys calabaricus]
MKGASSSPSNSPGNRIFQDRNSVSQVLRYISDCRAWELKQLRLRIGTDSGKRSHLLRINATEYRERDSASVLWTSLRGRFRRSSHQLSTASLLKERPTTSTTSKVAYFKRKYAEEEDLQKDYHGYFQKHLILPEDRTCILRLSLQKLRFLEDPEAYLRRSVLINNLLRKIHHESTKEDCECYDRTSDTRKRFKMMAANCCPQPFYLEELGMVPYGCRLDFPSGPQGSSSQLLMYQIDDNG